MNIIPKNKNKKQNTLLWIITTGVVMTGLVCCGLWVIRNQRTSIAETEEPTDEQMEQYFAEYTEATTKNDPENLLIVMSEGRPETYGAVDVVEAPGHTYYLMYESAEARDAAYEKLELNESVSVEKNGRMQMLDYNSWGIEAMGLDEARETMGYGNQSVRVAIIDTGLDMDAFRQKYPDIDVSTYDVETDSSYSEMSDEIGHGTHVAGTIAEGMPKNGSLYIIRAMRSGETEFYVSDVTTALERAQYSSAKVVNMSLGAYDYISSQWEAIDDLKGSNIITVAAAGNDGTNTVMYPAAYDNTIAVSAINQNKTLAYYSNYGPSIDFAAPGTDILSVNGIKSGTSMATPHVAAAVATLKSFNQYLSFNDINTLLRQHVQDLGTAGKDGEFGYGLINLEGAEYCEWDGYCDEYGVFKAAVPVYGKMEIDNVVLTPVNYYSISNLMLTEVKLYTDETNYVAKKLQDVKDLTVSGYDPEANGPQTVTIACEGVSKTVQVTNPNEYTPGWEYRLDDHDQVFLTRYYDVRDYDDENYDTSLKRLYVPNQINGKDVVELSETQRTVEYGDGDSYETTDSVFERSDFANYNLREVFLPDTLTVIRDETFWNFPKLEKVVMAANAVRLGDWAFMSDYNLRTVEGSIIEMGDSAFSSDNRLEAIELAEGLTTIPSYAFSGCYSLEEITIPSTVTLIDRSAFGSTKSLKRVVFSGNNVTTIGSYAFNGAESLTSVTLPEGLEEIDGGAFSGTGLTTVRIPASVTEIRSGAFSRNEKLESITVDANNSKYYDIDGKALMYDDYDRKNLVMGTLSMTIPEGTTDIGSSAFAGFKKTGWLIIPESVTRIGGDAFYGCTGLTDVVIPKLDKYSSLNGAFERESRNSYGSTINVPLDAKLWVYYDGVAYNYAVDRGFNYQTLDATYARIVEPFEPGDMLLSEMEVELYQDYGTRENGAFINYTGLDGEKTILTVGQLTATAYAGEVEKFRLGDTYFMATYKDMLTKDATIRVMVTVDGEYPEYTVPSGLTGKLRKNLSDVELPEGFSWMDSVYLYELGEFTFMSMYTPDDTTIYAPIENIPVTVTVVPGREKLPDPVVTVDSKVYDGSWEIDASLMHVTIDGLDESDYDVYGSTSSYEVGVTTGFITINLHYDTAEEYGFGDNYESWYTYWIDEYEILPASEPELEIEDKTGGVAEFEVVADGIVVTAEKACTVIVTYDGGANYGRALATWVSGDNYKFNFEITEDVEVLLVLKGDGDQDGEVSTGDSNLITRSIISNSLRPYRPLTALEQLILDVDGDGEISSSDSNLMNRSLISESLRPYRPIAW